MSASLREVVANLLDIMGERKELKSLDPCTQEMLDSALERVVEGTDSRISLVPDYKRKLYKSIIKSLNYADTIIQQIPSPVELNSRAFVDNPYIRAFFPTLSGLKKVCNQSSELKEYFEDSSHLDAEESCALLCMRKEEETVLGMHLEGQQVIRDVKQIRVNFLNHRIQSPAADESTARRELKCCLFEGLVTNALANISELRAKRHQLETQQRILSARLRGRGKNVNMQSMAEENVSLRNETIKLEQIEKELEEIGYVTPEVSLEQVNHILDHPEEFVSLNHISMRLDKSGIKHSENEQSASYSQIELSEVNIKGHSVRVVALAKIRRDEIESQQTDFPLIL
ncbi:MAG: hypothetical protein OQK71_06615 [Desulfobacter sp.]|nr:hypothetical protein [Desulfobacter sp.]